MSMMKHSNSKYRRISKEPPRVVAGACDSQCPPRYVAALWGIALLLLSLSLSGCQEKKVDPADPDWNRAAARDSLNEKSWRMQQKKNWYNSRTDELRPIKLVKPPARNRSSGGSDFKLDFVLLLVKLLAWLALGMLILVIAYMIARMQLKRLHRARSRDELGDQENQLRRIEALPLAGRRRDMPLLDMARSFYEEGNYAEAIVYLFSYQLLEMDQCRLIRLSKGKTNRQYISELQRSGQHRTIQQLQQLVDHTIDVFEDSYFGNKPLDRERFETCWNQLTRFEQLLVEVRS